MTEEDFRLWFFRAVNDLIETGDRVNAKAPTTYAVVLRKASALLHAEEEGRAARRHVAAAARYGYGPDNEALWPDGEGRDPFRGRR